MKRPPPFYMDVFNPDFSYVKIPGQFFNRSIDTRLYGQKDVAMEGW